MKRINRLLYDALVNLNVLSESEIAPYLSEAQSNGKLLRNILLEKDVVTEKQIIIALSQTLGLELIDFNKVTVDEAVISRVPIKIADYYQFMPVRIEGNVLTIASSKPLDVRVIDAIRAHLGVQVKVALCDERMLSNTLKKYYGFASDTIDRIKSREPVNSGVANQHSDHWIEDLERKSDDPTISHLVNEIILEAYQKRATDIHIEPYRDKVRFRYRIDGVLVDANLSQDVRGFLPQILSRIKILANLSITEKRRPQDGSAVVRTKDQNLDLRISTLPTPSGESIVIRILPTKVISLSLENLGFNRSSVEVFHNLIKKPHGIIFLTGPTGSGKTTTLYACLNEINSTERKIITIEDPVEYEMDGITQIQVNPKIDFTFASGLRSILRHDPDILMVGEVRDPETAEIAIKTALTGHLVFSTLHTNDASSGITRLIDMGIEPYLVASSVEAFVAQRLVRVICPKCKQEDKGPLSSIEDEIRKSLKLTAEKEIKFYKGIGCDHCNQTGFYGRSAVYGILIVDDVIRTAILEKPRADYIKKIAMQQGHETLRQNGWRAVLEGITTPQEVMNVTVKDEIIEREVNQNNAGANIYQALSEKKENDHLIRLRKKSNWVSRNDYRSRIYPRVYGGIEIRYKALSKDINTKDEYVLENQEYVIESKDFSAGGLSFISKEVIHVGTMLSLSIKLNNESKEVHCHGRVCRVEEESLKKEYLIVLYYLDITNDDRVMVNNFIAEKINEKDTVRQ